VENSATIFPTKPADFSASCTQFVCNQLPKPARFFDHFLNFDATLRFGRYDCEKSFLSQMTSVFANYGSTAQRAYDRDFQENKYRGPCDPHISALSSLHIWWSTMCVLRMCFDIADSQPPLLGLQVQGAAHTAAYRLGGIPQPVLFP